MLVSGIAKIPVPQWGRQLRKISNILKHLSLLAVMREVGLELAPYILMVMISRQTNLRVNWKDPVFISVLQL